MPFEKIPGFDGLVFVPYERVAQKKKHPCADCFACQFCDDDRCRICRNENSCANRDERPSSKKAN